VSQVVGTVDVSRHEDLAFELGVSYLPCFALFRCLEPGLLIAGCSGPLMRALAAMPSRNNAAASTFTEQDAALAVERCREFALAMDDDNLPRARATALKRPLSSSAGGSAPHRLVQKISTTRPLRVFVAGDRSKVGKSRSVAHGKPRPATRPQYPNEVIQGRVVMGCDGAQRVFGAAGEPAEAGGLTERAGIHQTRDAVRGASGAGVELPGSAGLPSNDANVPAQLVTKWCDTKGVENRGIGPVVFYKGFTREFLDGNVGTSQDLLAEIRKAVDQMSKGKKVKLGFIQCIPPACWSVWIVPRSLC
jgi:hypothetical protein